VHFPVLQFLCVVHVILPVVDKAHKKEVNRLGFDFTKQVHAFSGVMTHPIGVHRTQSRQERRMQQIVLILHTHVEG
jgi:hypothetical protein